MPPWKDTSNNPTVLPNFPSCNGYLNTRVDTHIPPGGELPDKIPFDDYIAIQHYVFIDLIFDPNPGTNLSEFTILDGPILIKRWAEVNGGQWRYRLIKSGQTLIRPL